MNSGIEPRGELGDGEGELGVARRADASQPRLPARTLPERHLEEPEGRTPVDMRVGTESIPRLQRLGSATQLIVEGAPFLVLGGELANSSASDVEYFEPLWAKLQALNCNTVLAPVYWELLEPVEREFDFTLVDELLEGARQHRLRLVLLWFGSFKNSMSCYAPHWVKTHPERFPRARLPSGRGVEILSAFSRANRAADAHAFAVLMRHLRRVDDGHRTVLMVQVENEVGMLGAAREHGTAADAAFAEVVPPVLLDHLTRHQAEVSPTLRERWEAAGRHGHGTWEGVFGEGAATEEIFMAWHYARYVNEVVAAGKSEYPLPMFTNAALNRPGREPGQYPSGGPLPHLLDVWQVGAPALNLLCPDIYFSDFAKWCEGYHRAGNPLFIPEARRSAESAANAFHAVGQHDAIGFSPFAIESCDDPAADPITLAYDVLGQLAPLILAHQGKGSMAGIALDHNCTKRRVVLGGYTLELSHDFTWEHSPGAGHEEPWPRAGALVIAAAPDAFTVAGTGVIVTFEPHPAGNEVAGISCIEEGRYMNGRWHPGRRLNGDESHQGRHLRIPHGQFGIQRVKLYRYR